MATPVFSGEPVHAMRFGLVPEDYASASDALLDAFMWAATKAAELCEGDARRYGPRNTLTPKLLGYAKEWSDIAGLAADELRSRDVQPLYDEERR